MSLVADCRNRAGRSLAHATDRRSGHPPPRFTQQPICSRAHDQCTHMQHRLLVRTIHRILALATSITQVQAPRAEKTGWLSWLNFTWPLTRLPASQPAPGTPNRALPWSFRHPALGWFEFIYLCFCVFDRTRFWPCLLASFSGIPHHAIPIFRRAPQDVRPVLCHPEGPPPQGPVLQAGRILWGAGRSAVAQHLHGHEHAG